MPTADPITAPDTATLLALLGAGPWALLTGAGLSTNSGVPAYRDRHGRWQHAKPIQHQEFLASEVVRRRYWARSHVGWQTMSRAEPNAGHRAIAELERLGLVGTVITQNVDGLHHQAIEGASALLVGGASLQVYSGLRFVEQAHRLGKPVVAINQGTTRADALLAAKLDHDCSEALTALLKACQP